MTDKKLRNKFAGMALQGLCANPNVIKAEDIVGLRVDKKDGTTLVGCAVTLADNLIDELGTKMEQG